MRVLGIDCGTERTGWGVIESDGRRHRVHAFGLISLTAKTPFEERLATIGAAMRALLAEHAPAAAAVEEVFYSQNVKTALKLAHVRGVVLAAIAEARCPLGEYSPLSVKLNVVGYGRAEKSQVQLRVRTLTGETIESEDSADAMAVAICHAVTCSTALPTLSTKAAALLQMPSASPRRRAAKRLA